jgi:putative colanic acid biosynthesis glycosyltransferase
MPTLLQINSNLNSGGAGRIVEQIGKGAILNGWDSYIAYGRLKNPSESTAIKIGHRLDIIFHGLKSLIFDMHGLGSRSATYKLISNIERIKPDIIHLHGLHGYYLNFEILFSFLQRSDVPVVWTMHDCWAITGHCAFFSDINCLKWETICFECPKKKNYPTSFFLDRSKQNFLKKKAIFNSVPNLTIVSVSKWLNGIIQRSFLANKNLATIINGIDINAFHPTIKNIYEIRKKIGVHDKFMLLGVATAWGVRKGWLDYIKLSIVLPEDYSIVMVGLTKKQIDEIPPRIIAIQRTESISELVDLYSAADIVLNLSYQESFGLTTVEGFACGTPGIVYNCTASPELITEDTGLVVEAGDINSLLEAISTIRRNGKSYYTTNCRKRAIDFFNIEDRINDFMDLYNRLLNN